MPYFGNARLVINMDMICEIPFKDNRTYQIPEKDPCTDQ